MQHNDTAQAMIRERVEGALRDHDPSQYDIDGIVGDLLDAGHRTAGSAATIAAAWMIGDANFWQIVRDHALVTPGLLVARTQRNGWELATTGSLTDQEAMALRFSARPSEVRLGAYVEVIDANGYRTGHLSRATYKEQRAGLAPRSPWVLCEIELS